MNLFNSFIFTLIIVTLTSCQRSNNAITPDITTDLVAYYPFSGNALDNSGNGFHGTVYGALLTNDLYGKSNAAFRFSGNSRIDIPALTPLNNSLNATFSFWKRTIAVNNYGQNFRVLNLGGKFFIFMDAMSLYKRDSISIINSNQFNILSGVKNDLGNWNHYVFTYDASKKTCNVYHNGKFISHNYMFSNRANNNSPSIFPFPVLSSADQSNIGSSFGSNPNEFNELDELRIYKRVLTEEQIAFLARR